MSDKEKVGREEVEVVAWLTTGTNPPRTRRAFNVNQADAKVQQRNWLPHHLTVTTDELMTVAQHQRITEALRTEVERLKDELETESMRLVACGVAALGYFDGCAEEYHSASLHDVLALRAQLAQQQGVPEGWKLVPVEPTEEMLGIGCIYADSYAAMLAAVGEAPVQAEPASQWVAVSERLPESERTVLAYYLNSHGKVRRIRAEYIAAKTKGADDGWDEEYTADYDEETDQYYWPAGWYEVMDNWDGLTHVAVVEGEVTAWMPLPPAPEVV